MDLFRKILASGIKQAERTLLLAFAYFAEEDRANPDLGDVARIAGYTDSYTDAILKGVLDKGYLVVTRPATEEGTTEFRIATEALPSKIWTVEKVSSFRRADDVSNRMREVETLRNSREVVEGTTTSAATIHAKVEGTAKPSRSQDLFSKVDNNLKGAGAHPQARDTTGKQASQEGNSNADLNLTSVVTFTLDSWQWQGAKWFYAKLQEKGKLPVHLVRTSPEVLARELNEWAQELDKLNRIDGVDTEEIKAILHWLIYVDDWWIDSGNIQTLRKLRRKNKDKVPYWSTFLMRAKAHYEKTDRGLKAARTAEAAEGARRFLATRS